MKKGEVGTRGLSLWIKLWMKWICLLILMIFALTQLGVFDLLTCILLLFILTLVRIRSLKSIKEFPTRIKTAGLRLMTLLFEFTEKRKESIGIRSDFRVSGLILNASGKRVLGALLVITIALAALITRIDYLNDFASAFPRNWAEELISIKKVSNQQWFLGELAVNGEFGLMNFYSQLTQTMPEQVLQSFGVLEGILLSVLIFWFVGGITNSERSAPLISAFVFIFFYTIIPVSTDLLAQHNTTYLAFSLALPLMLYILKPKELYTRLNKYFIWIFILCLTLGLIDLFTLLVVMPVFFVTTFVLFFKENRAYFKRALAGYLLGVTTVLFLYWLVSIMLQADFVLFLKSELVSTLDFSYMPELILPVDQLMGLYFIGSLVALLVMCCMIYSGNIAWRNSAGITFFFNILLFLYFSKSPWIDQDQLHQVFTILCSIFIGVVFTIIKFPLHVLLKRINVPSALTSVVLSASILVSLFWLQKESSPRSQLPETLPRDLFQAYSKITKNYLPYSYAMVNVSKTESWSLNRHYFMGYRAFSEDYLAIDSVYAAFKGNASAFDKAPENIPPERIFVFFINDINSEMQELSADYERYKTLILRQIELLKRKGRNIQVFYETDNIKIFEIINRTGAGKVRELLFPEKTITSR